MADAFHPSSTFVDIDVPDVATPVWTPGLQTRMSGFPYTPIQSTVLQSRTHVQFAPSALSPNTPVRSLVWDGTQDQMQLCTPSPAGTVGDGSQVSAGAQKARGGSPTLLVVNICLSMMVFYLLFIFGINNPIQHENVTKVSDQNKIPESDYNKYPDEGPCTAFTALLQYFLLATFTWNTLYGINVFMLFQNSVSGTPRWFPKVSMAVGWVAGWLQWTTNKGSIKKPMFWGFVLPLMIMLITNTAILLHFSYNICKTNPNLNRSRTTPLKKKLLSSFSLAVMLGLSWLTGYILLINQDKVIVVSVVFCLLTTSQGTLEENMFVASSVQMLTSKPEQLTSQNITSAATIVNNLLSATMLNESVAESVVATISQLMHTDEDQYSEDTYDALESLTKALEDFALNMSNINSNVMVQPNLAVQSIKLSNWTSQVQFYPVTGLSQNSPERIGQTLRGNAFNMTSSSGHPVDLLLTIKLQNKSQKDLGNRNLSIGVVLYENDCFFNSKLFNSELDTKRRVVAASLTDKNFLDNVEFAMWPENISSSTSYDFACVFWDYTHRDWRTEGCVKILDSTGVHCECNHTTNFLWLSFRADYTYSGVLNWISIVGCSLSVVGLVLTAVYQIKRKARGGSPTLLVVNICLSMMVFYLLFIFGINNPIQHENVAKVSDQNKIPESDYKKYPDEGPCTAFTALLQYFLLATFTWNTLYGINVYMLFQNSVSGTPRWFPKVSMPVGWGLPAVIVGISLGSTYRVEDPLGYRQEEFCWLASVDHKQRFNIKKPMFWGFVLPLMIMLITNTAILLHFSYNICKTNPNLNRSRTTPLKKKLLSSFSLAVMLGLSWVTGYILLITQEKTLQLILSVVFCLLNTTQVDDDLMAVVIAVLTSSVMYVLFDKQVNTKLRMSGIEHRAPGSPFWFAGFTTFGKESTVFWEFLAIVCLCDLN
ncbi:hypothetical protein Q8A67_006128 [Cirrhinus molitorella]|uniref:G-protein coupled receptors family 2 profile 2 domain-containing protein n=1 Tax=Cirrhinus molitorella TaxID=172907 RepID=A0AA88Q7B0_9TELE|nr:hypothetical protein Q8A67_006128 [Cirrhinus molitorella]